MSETTCDANGTSRQIKEDKKKLFPAAISFSRMFSHPWPLSITFIWFSNQVNQIKNTHTYTNWPHEVVYFTDWKTSILAVFQSKCYETAVRKHWLWVWPFLCVCCWADCWWVRMMQLYSRGRSQWYNMGIWVNLLYEKKNTFMSKLHGNKHKQSVL